MVRWLDALVYGAESLETESLLDQLVTEKIRHPSSK